MMKEHPRRKGYLVSDKGEVFSVKSNRFRKPTKHSGGYLTLSFTGNKSRNEYVHRMVWEAFVGPIPEGLEINHKDGKKENNSLCNLEVVTSKENSKHRAEVLKKGFGATRGNSPRAKLSEEQVRHIRESNESSRELSLKFKVHQGHINNIRANKSWK